MVQSLAPSSRSPSSASSRTVFATALAFSIASFGAAAAEQSRLDAALALYNAQQNAEAERAFEALAHDEPNNSDIHHHLGYLALRRGDADAALAHFQKAVALNPNKGAHQRGLGDSFGRQAQKASLFSKPGLAKKCLAAYLRAAELDPNDVQTRNNLFEYYRQAPGFMGGGTDKALAEAAVIKKLDPSRGHFAFATLYTGEKKYAEAFAEYEAALQLAPDNFYVAYQIGKLADTTGENLDRGLAALRRCLELPPLDAHGGPGYAAVHWRIGNILQKKADVLSARAAYQAALAADPKFPPASEALAKLK